MNDTHSSGHDRGWKNVLNPNLHENGEDVYLNYGTSSHNLTLSLRCMMSWKSAREVFSKVTPNEARVPRIVKDNYWCLLKIWYELGIIFKGQHNKLILEQKDINKQQDKTLETNKTSEFKKV